MKSSTAAAPSLLSVWPPRPLPRRGTRALAAALMLVVLPAAGRAGGPINLASPRPSVTAARAAAVRQDRLAARIDAVLGRPELRRAHVGVEVADPATGRVLYARDAEKLLVPASNLKLVVTSTAAHLLGPAYRWRTTVYGTGPVEAGVLRGDLVLFGRGDPTLSGRYGPTRTAGLEALADSLRARGIRRVAGAVVGDESWFDGEHVRGEWQTYDLLWWYAAPVGALAFNDNSVDFRIDPGAAAGEPARISWEPRTAYVRFENRTRTVAAGRPQTLDLERGAGPGAIRAYGETPLNAGPRTESFAVDDAARYAATVFREVLAARGIAVDAPEVRVVSDPARSAAATATPLAERLSPPLPQVVAPILLKSQNWIAEQLLKTLARERRGEGSWDAGLALERDFLTRVVGVDSTAFKLRDASGLSAENLVTPHAFVQILSYVRRTPQQEMVRAGLPVAGRAGSLQSRLPDLTGRVAAKTGSIGNVDSLSGFATTGDGRQVVFSIIVNGSGLPAARVRAAIDDVVRAIAAEA
jgi:D-alanyl-D-alanine carboxypeptidase/D-alanyl-D-alanine-endopeptidase (penicillin-binding protein 4)